MRTMEYDISELEKLFADLSDKERVKALKGGFRKSAAKVRNAAVSDLRSGMSSNRNLEKGVRSIVFKRTAGFRVTVGTKMKRSKSRNGWIGVAGFYENRQVRRNPSKYSPRPVLIWAEDGTGQRRTKSNSGRHTRMFGTRSRSSHPTGAIKPVRFMVSAKNKVASSVTSDIHENVKDYVVKVAKKHGCRT